MATIKASTDFTLLIKTDGSLWTWGLNTYGQLGINSAANAGSKKVSGVNKTFCQVDAGQYHSIAIDKYGKIWTWGYNNYGQLGNNMLYSFSTPTAIAGTLKTFCKIAGGLYHSLALDNHNNVWGWGYKSYLANDYMPIKPVLMYEPNSAVTFCEISSGYFATILIDKYGKVWGWGYNNKGQLGDNTTVNRSSPVAVCGITKTFCKISINTKTSFGIDKNGKAWGWGYNGQGQLGNGNTTGVNQSSPVAVLGINKTFCDISGGGFSVGLDSNEQFWVWGDMAYLCNIQGTASNSTPVFYVGQKKTFCQIATMIEDYSMLLDKNGTPWGTGLNQGRIGDNTYTSKSTFVSIVGRKKTFCQIASTGSASIAIDKYGKIWAWGLNTKGELGNNTAGAAQAKSTPVSVGGTLKTFCQISGGGFYGMAIDNNGKIWGWGYNNYGKLGNNNTTSYSTPISVGGANKTFCKIAMGVSSAAIDKNGKVWGWGNNQYGQLGDNTVTAKSTPISVGGATKTFCKIANGGYVIMAIDKNGRLWGWGYNQSGMIGDNSSTPRSTPVSVKGAVKTFCEIATGYHTLAIDKNGRLWSWGYNIYGQLGTNNNNVTYKASTPVLVSGTVKTFCKIGVGTYHSIAIDKNNNVWLWGQNFYGECGIPVNVATPIQIQI